ncbi:MAG: creatininase family protein [Ruminococcaceae bacterium]|nr:creatininase family protein [Oscillospiraceae bacterium]
MENAILWENLKAPDFPEAIEKSKGVCVVPIGAMEKHGPHMPVGTDNIIAERTAILAAEKEPVVIFPTFGFGDINCLQPLHGSICFSTKLLFDYLTELCREIARNGFKKILLLNAHGGNPPLLTTFCRSNREKKLDYVVMFANSYGTTPADMRKAFKERREEFSYITDEDIGIVEKYFEKPMAKGHADFDELLLVYNERPHTIDMERMGDEDGEDTFRTEHLREFGIFSGGNFLADCPNSYSASYFPYVNERLARAYTDIRVDYIAKMFKTVKEDTVLLEENEKWNQSW